MNDLISREAAINYLTKARIVGDSRPMTEIFAEIPSANQWIPCSEELPDNLKCALVYFKEVHTRGYGYDIAVYADRKWYGNVLEKRRGQVIAWQPLPEPYVEVEE